MKFRFPLINLRARVQWGHRESLDCTVFFYFPSLVEFCFSNIHCHCSCWLHIEQWNIVADTFVLLHCESLLSICTSWIVSFIELYRINSVVDCCSMNGENRRNIKWYRMLQKYACRPVHTAMHAHFPEKSLNYSSWWPQRRSNATAEQSQVLKSCIHCTCSTFLCSFIYGHWSIGLCVLRSTHLCHRMGAEASPIPCLLTHIHHLIFQWT